MHDIGKTEVAGSVLNQQGCLDDYGVSVMKEHPEAGAEILSGIDMDIPGLRDGICHHHER